MTKALSSQIRGDRVPPDVRAAERDIDNAYRSNVLMTVNRSHALPQFLAECEKWYMDAIVGDHPSPSMLSHVVTTLATPAMLWLWKTCEVDGQSISNLGRDHHQAAHDLALLAHKYSQCETVFTFASRGRVSLTRSGNRVLATRRTDDTRRDAYDHLVDLTERTDPRFVLSSDGETVRDLVPTVYVDGDRFHYQLDSECYRRNLCYLRPKFDQLFPSPPDWRIGSSSLMEYRAVFECMIVLSVVHTKVRWIAIQNGCDRSKWPDSLVMEDRERLVGRITKYTEVARSVVDSIIRDLTFGEREMREPDIALQPIVALSDRDVCWAPSLVRDSNHERNLLVLLRRFLGGKDAYSVVSGQREDAQRERLVNALESAGFRCWHGRVTEWTPSDDVDLVVVDDREEQILILELKSFAAPGDPRELDEKAYEIEKGIDQIRARRKMATDRAEALYRKLSVDAGFFVSFAVVSDTSVGHGLVDPDDVAVVRTSDLIRKVNSGTGLREIVNWLTEGAFLPVPGVDYEEVEDPVEIAGWTLEWYRISTVPGVPKRRDSGQERAEASGAGK